MKKSTCVRCNQVITLTPFALQLWGDPGGSANCPATSGLEHIPASDTKTPTITEAEEA